MRGPHEFPDRFARGDDLGGGGRDAIAGYILKDIEGRNPFRIVRIEIDKIARAAAGKCVEELMLEIAVRINDADAPASVHVLNNDVLECSRLSHTRLADDEHVVHAVELAQREVFLAGMSEYASKDRTRRIEVKDHTPGSALRSRFPEQGSDVNTQWLA